MSTFSYAEAVKLMGAKEHKLVTALDKVLSGTLLAGSVLDVFGLLGWFDAKSDFIRLSHEYAVKLSERRSGLSRYDRTQRLHAAHTMIVLASLFEALDELGVAARTKDLDLRSDGIIPKVPQQLLGLAVSPVPLVTPERPYEDNLRALTEYYQELTEGLRSFLAGLSVWDEMDDRERGRLAKLPDAACRCYEENIRRLATDSPEFAFWSSLQDHQGTRVEVRRVGTALAEMERLLMALAVGNNPHLRRRELTARYRSVLDLPIIEPDQVPAGLGIPLFRDCYIDPRFQVGSPPYPAQTQSWEHLPVRSDVHEFFTGYLTSPKATQAPLLVLGDPGSGKSVLTKVLAARLPATDFMPLRVELRTTPTEAELLQQIEHGLEIALQEHVSWAEWTRSADGALPVVFLDGFDELLQATGVSQTGYLKKVQQLQRESAAMGRPVAIVVTSRISVADRATIPEHAAIMRLAPFNADQTNRWLDAWNAANARYFESLGLGQLESETALTYPRLAEQPLLLLMLALYDADGNALQRNKGSMGEAELYERLLVRFARREIVKDKEERSEEQIEEEVEGELERLSVVALAMFNRSAQWITEHELDRDLTALLGDQPRRSGVRTPLGAGEAVLGRFFFIQRAQAVRDEKTLRTYEFLHATFGEYLVARFAWHTMRDLLQVEKALPRLARGRALDDSELYSLLSFAPLSSRLPVIQFLQEMADVDAACAELAKMLVRVFHDAHRHRNRSEYEPADLLLPARYAIYSANIMLLSVITHRELLVSDLLSSIHEVRDKWIQLTLLWKSQLHGDSWWSLLDVLHMTKIWRSEKPDMQLRISRPEDEVPSIDVDWLFGFLPSLRTHDVYGISARRDAYLICDWPAALDEHSLAPVAQSGLHNLVLRSGDHCATPLHAILYLLLNRDGDSVRRRGMWEILSIGWRRWQQLPALWQELMPVIVQLLRSAPDIDDVLPKIVGARVSTPEILELVLDRIGKRKMGRSYQRFRK